MKMRKKSLIQDYIYSKGQITGQQEVITKVQALKTSNQSNTNTNQRRQQMKKLILAVMILAVTLFMAGQVKAETVKPETELKAKAESFDCKIEVRQRATIAEKIITFGIARDRVISSKGINFSNVTEFESLLKNVFIGAGEIASPANRLYIECYNFDEVAGKKVIKITEYIDF